MEEALGGDRCPSIRLEYQVVGDAQRGRHAGPHPIFGDVADAASDGGERVAGAHRSSRNHHGASRWPAHAGDDFRQLALAVAGNPGNPHDLPSMDGQGHIAQGEGAEVAQGRDTQQVEDHLTLSSGRPLFLLGEDDIAPDHHPSQFARIGLGGRDRSDHLPTTEDRDPARDGHHLLELVGDEDHGPALGRHQAERFEEIFGLLGRQQGGGLVEDQDACPSVERL